MKGLGSFSDELFDAVARSVHQSVIIVTPNIEVKVFKNRNVLVGLPAFVFSGILSSAKICQGSFPSSRQRQ